MTRSPVVAAPETHLSEAVALMESRGVRHLPIVRDGRLVGLLSERHVRDALPSILTLSEREARRRFLAAARVDQVAITAPVVIGPEDTVLEAIRRMRRLRAGSLPVVERDRLVGIVTSADLLNAFERMLRLAMT
ncbi:MAG: CBS domain-containing protein [Sandaracinaceae bacterium]|nr:CBS domain-containing protein [Sandaracinaceae bacterium]